ncbi:MAG: hypothetical protein KAJ73_02070 [Zetaproteobacteria bacterium]|nr:hypothetical protein [Zetaproteobacteria bacterium]
MEELGKMRSEISDGNRMECRLKRGGSGETLYCQRAGEKGVVFEFGLPEKEVVTVPYGHWVVISVNGGDLTIKTMESQEFVKMYHVVDISKTWDNNEQYRQGNQDNQR